MKVIKLLSLWLLVFAMVLSSVSVFAEETANDENWGDNAYDTEEETETDNRFEEVPEEPVMEREIVSTDLGSADTSVTDTETESAPAMTAEEKAALREANREQRSSQYYKVSSALKSLGIYSFVDADQDMIVTRGEFAKMVTDLLGLSAEDHGGEAVFTDIAQSPYKTEIETVFHYGIMKGVGNSTFAPDGKITYIQAVKTVVSALGYDPIAEAKGGYPDGYKKVALDLKLLKGVNEGFDKPITFLSAANLIALSSRTAVLEPIGIRGEGIVYNNAPQKTVLSIYHNIYEGEGRMTDNGISAIGAKSAVGIESAVIGGKNLFGMKNSYRDYLGCNVRYFYKTEDGIDKLLFATTENISNNIVKLHSSELLCDNADFSAKKVVAQVNGKKQTYNIHPYVDFMYNGVIDTTFHNDSMKINSGTLTLVDADGDNVYEFVKAWEYSDVVVSSVHIADEKIVSKFGSKDYGNILYGEYDLAVFENAYGEEISPQDITEGSVLSVFKAKNDACIKFIISTDSKEITVSAIETDDDGTKILYDDSYAEFSYTYLMLNKADPGIYPIPSSDCRYTVLFNYEGYISMLTAVNRKDEYAYALAMAYGEGIDSNKVLIKLFFESNNSAVLPVAKKLSINGVKNKTGADLMADERIYQNGAIIPQLVKITLNAKGELTSIWIDTEIDNSVYGFNLEEFSLDYESGNSMYSDMTASGYPDRYVYRSYRISNDTKIFLIKKGVDKSLQATDAEDVRVITYSEYKGSYSGGKYIKMYDADESWRCGAVVISESQGLSARSFTVNKVSNIIDEDGIEKVALAGYWQNVYRVLREDDPGILEKEVLKRYPESDGKVHVGDVFELYLDVDGEISVAKLYYSPSRDTDPDYCFYDLYHSSSGVVMNTNNTIYILGYPLSITDGGIGVFTTANPDYVPLYNSKQTEGCEEMYFVHAFTTSTLFLKYDCQTKTVEKITLNDLYEAGQLTSQGFENIDKSTKVFFRKSSGIIYDLLLVTNVGN